MSDSNLPPETTACSASGPSSNGSHPAKPQDDHRLRIHSIWLRALCIPPLAFTVWLDATTDWEAPSWLLAGLLTFIVGFTPKQLKTFMS